MLKKLRSKKVSKKIWFILAALIVPSFILWGSGSLIQNISLSKNVGQAFGKKISLQEFKEALLATRNQLILQLGEEFFKQETQINLEPLALNRIILLYEAKKRGIKVDDKEVIEFIQRHPLFLHNGKFDLSTYNRIVQTISYMRPRMFEEKMREDLMLSKLYKQIASQVQLTDEQIKDAYIKENERISVTYLSASFKDFEDKVSVDENRIRDHFMKNPEQFKKPATFNLEYLYIEPPKKDQASDVKKWEEKIKNILLKFKKKRNLNEIAKELSLEIKETGFFSLKDPIPGIGWSMQIINILEKLKTGQIIPPIRTPDGWYIVKLKEKKESYLPPFEEIKDEVKEKFIKVKSKELARQNLEAALLRLKEIKDSLPSEEIHFDKTAREFNLNTGTTDLFKRASYIPGIGSSDKFFAAILNLEEGQISEIIEMEQGLYIIKLKQKEPIDGVKFETERVDFTNKLLLKEIEARFVEFLAELKRKANLKIFAELSL